MTENQVEFLESLLSSGFLVYWQDPEESSILHLVHSVEYEHKDHEADIPEEVAWLGNKKFGLAQTSKCVSLLIAEPCEFKIISQVSFDWPED